MTLTFDDGYVWYSGDEPRLEAHLRCTTRNKPVNESQCTNLYMVKYQRHESCHFV